MTEYLDLNEDSQAEQQRHADLLRKFEAQKRARSISVPTGIPEVKARLRELGLPVTLFGEDAGDRRERLREEIAKLELGQEEVAKLQEFLNRPAQPQPSSSTFVGTDGPRPPSSAPPTSHQTQHPQKDKEKDSTFYSPASEELIAARKLIAAFSFDRAKRRIQKSKRALQSDESMLTEYQHTLDLYTTGKELTLNSSQFGDDRPLTCVRYAASGGVAASGSLTTGVKVWDVSTLSCIGVLREHLERVTSVSWHPHSFLSDGPALLASSSADGSCVLWDCKEIAVQQQEEVGCTLSNESAAMDVESKEEEKEEREGAEERGGESERWEGSETNRSAVKESSASAKSKRGKLVGHHGVVSCTAFHPMGAHIATAGHDFSWRLWDVETARELQLQDGHTKECSAVAFHPDGSLLLSGDSSGVALLWDLRSGQCIQPLQGHIKKISGASFSANGFQTATCCLDNTVKIWDLRSRKCTYTLPAHPNIITDTHFSTSGEMLLTASFDGTLKLWATRDWRIVRTLAGHSGKVMSCDLSRDEKHVLSVGYDRTLKLWAHKDEF